MKNKKQQLQQFPILVKTIKFLILLVLIIFGYLFVKNNKSALSNFTFGSSKGSNSVNKNIPDKLKWQEQFKGVSNFDDGSKKDGESKNFLQYESSK